MVDTEKTKRIKFHAYFSVVAFCLPFVSSMVAVAITGSRGYAGLGPFISLPIIQFVYAFILIKRPVHLALVAAILISVISHLLSMAVIESKIVTLGLDRYGYFDFLAIYVICSVLLWEVAYASISKWRNRQSCSKGIPIDEVE